MKKKILFGLILVIVKVEAQTSTFSVADSLFAKGRYKLALKELDTKEASFLSNFKKAVIYESIDNYKKSAFYLEQAITFKDDEKAKLKLAKNYRALKQSRKAIPIYEEILAKDSLNLVLKYQLGTLYFEQKKPKMAVKMFEKAHFENRRNHRALYQYAKLSDDYYKDKKIAYKLYVKYLESVYDKDEVITAFVKKRVAAIKKDYFMRGELLD